MGKGTFYVTTPIYYVNDKPHIGHAYTTILADVLARGHRLLGDPTFFLTGTDEHGMKVQQAAAKLGYTPQEHCDKFVVPFQKLWERLGITNDDFIRTTQDRHKKIVQAILADLNERGLIYSDAYEGWYCVPCERFFTEKDLQDGLCPDCHRPVEKLVEKNYFFRMSQYQQQLIDYINAHPKFIQPAHRRQETLGFLNKPLGDLCISRPKARLSWGIELPFDKDYVTYVWFDALVNYISAVGYKADDEKFARWWPASYHLIGKDILTTHTVYWPTMLMAMGLPLPEAIFAHGWWLVGETKMSKSLGNVVNPMDILELYGADALRYFLMSAMSLGQDASFSEELFVLKFNSELANDLGNFASRVTAMVRKHFDGKLPPAAQPSEADAELRQAAQNAIEAMRAAIENMQLDRGCAAVNEAVKAGNRYFATMEPWTLAKNGKIAELGAVLRNSAELLRIVSGLLYPIMPDKMGKMRRLLGMSESEIEPQMDKLSQWNTLQDNAAIGDDSQPLFPRIQLVKSEPEKTPAKAKPEKQPKPSKPQEEPLPEGIITIDDFAKVQLKTAEITAAEPVAGSSHLLKLQLKVGDEARQILSGIAENYQPAELVGKTVIIVANLKPRKLLGQESRGMLLAAQDSQGQLRLLTTDGPLASGANVG